MLVRPLHTFAPCCNMRSTVIKVIANDWHSNLYPFHDEQDNLNIHFTTPNVNIIYYEVVYLIFKPDKLLKTLKITMKGLCLGC